MSHYTISAVNDDEAMDLLRKIFPEAQANDLNFCLFSTSGVHGTYATIEDVESGESEALTFMVIKPRMVSVLYGNCIPKTDEDFAFLKQLRESSSKAMNGIAENSGLRLG